MKVFNTLAVLFFAVLCGVHTIAAFQRSTGLVTRISGSASYIGTQKKADAPSAKDAPSTKEVPSMKVVPFMKVYDGDIITLEPGASLQLVFFGNGRKELWNGPAKIIVSPKEGKNDAGSGRARISSLPDTVVTEVRRIAKIVDPSQLQKSGAKVIRGQADTGKPPEKTGTIPLDPGEETEIRQARETYRSLTESGVESGGEGDILPELYLFSVLADYDQLEDMAELIALMKQKQPDNPSIDRLAQWFEEQF